MESSREVIRSLLLHGFQLGHNFQSAFDNINRARSRQVRGSTSVLMWAHFHNQHKRKLVNSDTNSKMSSQQHDLRVVIRYYWTRARFISVGQCRSAYGYDDQE
ncbi:hypothetical protein KIN20_006268 [Parelaphostrongylus tenuis]|uniref:Uncharacterized protein n=1 Tax=Parelaphostrongylus tenuis TaxID=148309 RepID=A0AAD5QGJ7_PARTN|nr:hypothetical protein KIN20_006268 [Parelaphostrongylus tenuis]